MKAKILMKYKKIIFAGVLILNIFCGKATSADNIDPSIPSIPNNFQGVDLKSSFNQAVGNGILYSDDNSVLQMSNGKLQVGALWGKNKIDLKKSFKLSTYLYLGNQGSSAADGMTFCLQQYSPNWVGENGRGIGAYSNKYPFTLALEFDTYFNGDGPDRFEGNGGNGLTKAGGNHIAFCASSHNWENYQYHYSPIELGSGEYLSNGSWKKLEISATPINDHQTTLSYTLQDLGSGKTYGKSCMVDFRSSWDDANHQFFTTNEVYWGFTSSTGAQMETAAMTFGSLPQTPTIATKDITIYQGEKWDVSQNFVSGNDETNTDFQFGDARLSSTNNVDTTKPGAYDVTYTYKNGSYTGTASAKVTVLEDKTNIKTSDSILYVGQDWNKESNFVSATNEDGTSIPWSDSRISSNDASVDTSKVGTYHLTYTIKGKLKNVDSSFTVTVKDNKSSIQTKNTTLQIGQTWDKESNFVSATDEDGNSIPWSDSRITSNGASVDTSKAGVTKLKYTYKGKVKNTDSEFTVTVEDPLKLIVPSDSDFGTYKLGSSNSVLNWNKSSKVEVEGANSSQWDLSVALNAKSSLKGYIKIGDQTISDQPQEVISGTGSMDVTGGVSSDNFIKVDYTGVKQVRKDTGNLEWTLNPSTKEVSE